MYSIYLLQLRFINQFGEIVYSASEITVKVILLFINIQNCICNLTQKFSIYDFFIKPF